MSKPFIRIGHRGACGYGPENTLLSFEKALQLNVDMIELDVQLCKTGEIIVIHDDKVDRTTNGKGYVSEKSFEELRSLDAGKGESIPLLSEVIDVIAREKIINIELKGEGTAQPVLALINEYIRGKGWSCDDFLISSFNHHALVEVKKTDPEIKIGVNTSSVPLGHAEFAQRLGAFSVHPSIEFINSAFVEDAHNRGLKVYVWTVNDYDDIERMKSMDVDGMFSDFPDRL